MAHGVHSGSAARVCRSLQSCPPCVAIKPPAQLRYIAVPTPHGLPPAPPSCPPRPATPGDRWPAILPRHVCHIDAAALGDLQTLAFSTRRDSLEVQQGCRPLQWRAPSLPADELFIRRNVTLSRSDLGHRFSSAACRALSLDRIVGLASSQVGGVDGGVMVEADTQSRVTVSASRPAPPRLGVLTPTARGSFWFARALCPGRMLIFCFVLKPFS